jgi:hypothetical protein
MNKPELKSAKEMDLHELEEFLKSDQSTLSHSVRGKPSPVQTHNLKIEKLEEQVKFLQEQCNFARSETKRIQDQYDIDKENWSLEMQHLKKMIQKPMNDEALKNELKKVKGFNKELQLKNEQLTSELLQIKKEFDLFKSAANKKTLNLECLIEKMKKRESELIRKNDERGKILDKNKSMNEKKPLMKNSRSGSCFHDKKKVDVSSGFGDEELKKEIEKVELIVVELTGRYKFLISKSDSGEIDSVREQLSKLTQELESKNLELFDLKKRHQASIRESLKRLDS